MEEIVTGSGLMSLCTDAFYPFTTDHVGPGGGNKRLNAGKLTNSPRRAGSYCRRLGSSDARLQI